jgi:ABC-type multidrug transport system ATPase subunit
MNIRLHNIGKRYNYEWIFRHVDLELKTGEHRVILGGNGSGKSTLLQVIASNLIASEGELIYEVSEKKVPDEQLFRHLSFAAPYLELYEDFTLTEAIMFQARFKPFFTGLSVKEIIALSGLEKAKDKQLKYFSSGMKQRVKLTLAVLADTPLLLLDEPASNLDKQAVIWYQELVSSHSSNRLIIVASNQQENEYPFCRKEMNVEEYKG